MAVRCSPPSIYIFDHPLRGAILRHLRSAMYQNVEKRQELVALVRIDRLQIACTHDALAYLCKNLCKRRNPVDGLCVTANVSAG